MNEVAIINMNSHGSYENDYIIINSITDWSVVSDEDLAILRKAVSFRYDLMLIERKDRNDQFIPNLIAEYIKEEKIKQEKLEQERAERERKRTEAALKRKAKTEAKEKQLLAKLLEKHGNVQ